MEGGDLVFDSSFESGNLGHVERVGDELLGEYHLYMRPDTLAEANRLWFHFSVSNTRSDQVALFHVMNTCKTRSSHRSGMTPVVRSKKRPQWVRIPQRDCWYYRHPKKHGRGYILSFLFAFDDPDDVYSFAYCYPYTFTDLQRFLYSLERQDLPHVRRELLGRSLQHRRLDLLRVTNHSRLLTPQGRPKKVIVVTARVHPGETPASFMCEGLVSFIVSEHPVAAVLRDYCVFLVIPMLNPDGVFLGNYRANSLGFDLNRCWLNPTEFQPTIVATKTLLQQLMDNSDQGVEELDFFVDMHSHSNSTSGFMYVNWSDDEALACEAMRMPRLLGVKSPYFSSSSTKYCRDPGKLNSGRRALGEFVLVGGKTRCHCYTFEVSFYCYHDSSRKVQAFSPQSYRELGGHLGEVFLDHYRLPNPMRSSRRLDRGAPLNPNLVVHLPTAASLHRQSSGTGEKGREGGEEEEEDDEEGGRQQELRNQRSSRSGAISFTV